MWEKSLCLCGSLEEVASGWKNKWGELGLGLGKAFGVQKNNVEGMGDSGGQWKLICQGGCWEILQLAHIK